MIITSFLARRCGFKTEEPSGESVTSPWDAKVLHTSMAHQTTTERSQISHTCIQGHILQEWKGGTHMYQPLAFCHLTQLHLLLMVPLGLISQASHLLQCTRTSCTDSTQDRRWHLFWKAHSAPPIPRNSAGQASRIWDLRPSNTVHHTQRQMQAKLLN